jgi:hypothetical protein
MDLFRHGGFATVDEFSNLASTKYPEHVQRMKHLMMLGLLLHNPEDKFETSDYYPFIQKLFEDNHLHCLKNNVTVLSYNYDCYLEFLLLKAQSIRRRLAGYSASEDWLKNTLTSGFFLPTETTCLTSSVDTFRLFKLHGSIAYANETAHQQIFTASIQERFKVLEKLNFKHYVPPVSFPWELFDEAGNFIHYQEFIFGKQPKDSQEQSDATILYNLYDTIWRGAREAVRKAKKISFVGMRTHPYLDTGLKYLFDGKDGNVEVVVANPENEYFKGKEDQLHRASLCGKVAITLRRIAPNMTCRKSFSEYDGNFSGTPHDDPPLGITPRYSFGEFIEREME